MSSQFALTSLDLPLSTFQLEGAVANSWLSGGCFALEGLDRYSRIAVSACRLLLWPFSQWQPQFDQIDSRDVDFIFSGERFPIDIFGSYDIDRAKSIIAGAPRTSKPADVAAWQAYADKMDWQQLSSALPDAEIDCSIPVIIATLDEAHGRYMLIDGWHRIAKANGGEQEMIQAFYLTEQETTEAFDISWRNL